MLASVPQLAKAELFARLADGHAARTTVVTPNRRLAQALARDFDQHQLARGLTAWETADILPFAAFVQRLHEDARYALNGTNPPALLTIDQEQALWEEIVRTSAAGSALLAVPETAAQAREAWQLAHEWQLLSGLRDPLLDEDAAAFAEWARRYAERAESAGVIDSARLPAWVARTLDEPSVKVPHVLVTYAFERFTPQQSTFFGALAARGMQLMAAAPICRTGKAVRVPALDARDEIRRVASWTRARLEANPSARIGIVVPDLAGWKYALRRALAQTLAPGRAPGKMPFNISLGDPLNAQPLVAHALAALALAGREIDFERASTVVRSPFIASGEDERERRALLDMMVRRQVGRVTTLDGLIRVAQGELARRLAAYAELSSQWRSAVRSPGEWAPACTAALAALGFPGERTLDSAEYQTLGKWHELLARFACLERVTPRISFDQAVARLQRMAAQTLFQPETPAVPIQVLGVLEASGMEFDHLWVMGLADEAWPMPARPNPFIPLRVQRAAQIPYASPAAALEAAERLTAEWLRGAGEVVLSHPGREADRALAASPLIGGIEAQPMPLEAQDSWRDTIYRSRRIEQLPDSQAPALRTGRRRGGATLLKDQAACGFRALARHRLAATGIEAPQAGLDQSQRGMLVHLVLANVWRALRSKQGLQACAEPALQAVLVRAVTDAMAEAARKARIAVGRRFAEIEKARLIKLARDWLELERTRCADFSVIAIEEERAVTVGPLELRVRLDRVDETQGGARIVLDYKTGDAKLGAICGPRPDEPQLPLYVTACEPTAVAGALAQLRPDRMRFVGLALDQHLLPGVVTPERADKRAGAARTWPLQREQWQAELERLANEFAAGYAPANPKQGLNTCRTCGLQALCRIHEHLTRETA